MVVRKTPEWVKEQRLATAALGRAFEYDAGSRSREVAMEKAEEHIGRAIRCDDMKPWKGRSALQ